MLNGKTIAVNSEEDATIQSVKQQINDKEGIFVDQLKFILGGKSLEDDKTIADYSIKSGAKIHCVLQLRGGK